jgi:hypothetical protein
MTEIKPADTPSVRSIPSDPEKDGNLAVDENEYIDPKIEKSLVRKFDLLILPMCGESPTKYTQYMHISNVRAELTLTHSTRLLQPYP